MDPGFFFATLNAVLNASSAVCLVVGFVFRRQKKIENHKKMMVTAFVLSVLFLVSYGIRYSLTGVHRYAGEGVLKCVYFLVLGTHTPLATLVPFLAIRTLFLGLKGRVEEHRRWARWTFPVWLYVSVTGVLVYLMLYAPVLYR